MNKLGIGIVGTGLIASVIANAIHNSSRATLVAVSSRSRDHAEAFAARWPGIAPFTGLAPLLASDAVQALYIATPTAAKEALVVEALAAGKHVLVDKPFVSADSVARMIAAADAANLALMDASHFVHHPRTAAIKACIPERIGAHRSLHAAFHISFPDRANIRYDRQLEPMGALGDLGWYAMRAIVEYLRPAGTLAKVAAVAERDQTTQALLRASGLLGFDSGESATFDVGYAVNTTVMDLRLTGDQGVISLDDFSLDWTNSIAHHNPDIATGYRYRSGRATPKTWSFIETPSPTPAHVLMIDNFANLVARGDTPQRTAWAGAILRTQGYLDAAWNALA